MTRRIAIPSAAFAILALIAVAGTGCQAGGSQEGQNDVIVAIEGMDCDGCCTKVETAVKGLAGVVAAEADYEAGSATITYLEGEVTVEEIVAAIHEKTEFKASVPAPGGA